MSGYENAAATHLLATHCAICNRPLVDSESVERGVGPTCAERYGVGDAQADPVWELVQATLASVDQDLREDTPVDLRKLGQHAAANLLVHRIALDRGHVSVPAMIDAIGHLGFHTLAEILRERIVEAAVEVRIEIDRERDIYLVETPYDPGVVQAMRSIPGRRWDAERKANTFPTSARRELWGLLVAYYPGSVAKGPQGLFTITDNR